MSTNVKVFHAYRRDGNGARCGAFGKYMIAEADWLTPLTERGLHCQRCDDILSGRARERGLVQINLLKGRGQWAPINPPTAAAKPTRAALALEHAPDALGVCSRCGTHGHVWGFPGDWLDKPIGTAIPLYCLTCLVLHVSEGTSMILKALGS